jgi:hypothetical protein
MVTNKSTWIDPQPEDCTTAADAATVATNADWVEELSKEHRVPYWRKRGHGRDDLARAGTACMAEVGLP